MHLEDEDLEHGDDGGDYREQAARWLAWKYRRRQARLWRLAWHAEEVWEKLALIGAGAALGMAVRYLIGC